MFAADDDFFGHLLCGELEPATGLVADSTPPFALYPANLNHVGTFGNPFLGLAQEVSVRPDERRTETGAGPDARGTTLHGSVIG